MGQDKLCFTNSEEIHANTFYYVFICCIHKVYFFSNKTMVNLKHKQINEIHNVLIANTIPKQCVFLVNKIQIADVMGGFSNLRLVQGQVVVLGSVLVEDLVRFTELCCILNVAYESRDVIISVLTVGIPPLKVYRPSDKRYKHPIIVIGNLRFIGKIQQEMYLLELILCYSDITFKNH